MKETKKQILQMWEETIEKIDSGTVNISKSIEKAYISAHGFGSGWFVDVYANGEIGSIRSQNSSSFCHWHGMGDACPECAPIFSVEGWNIWDFSCQTMEERKEDIENIEDVTQKEEAMAEYEEAKNEQKEVYDTEARRYFSISEIIECFAEDWASECRDFEEEIAQYLERYAKEVEE